MTALTISRSATTAMQVAQFIRNGKAPTADIQNQLATMVGYAANVRAKCIFAGSGGLCGTGGVSLVPDSLATRARWRFAFHTSPYHWYLMARFEIAPENGGSPTSPSCRIDIATTARVVVGRSSVYGGSSDGSYADVPINMTGGTTIVLDAADPDSIAPLAVDTEYTGVFYDIGQARLMAASIWEVTLEPDTDNGYAANNHASGGPIYSSDRNDVAAMARLLHKRSGTPVFHWCSNVDSEAPFQTSGASTAAAAMTLGELTLSATGGTSGTGDAALTLGAMTVSATGVTTATLSYVASMSPDPVAHLGTLTGTISVIVGGAEQTNLDATFYIRDSSGNLVTLLDEPTTTGSDGFTVNWISVDDGLWACEISRATASVTTYTVQFQCNPYKHSHADVGVDWVSGQSTEVPSASTTDDFATFS